MFAPAQGSDALALSSVLSMVARKLRPFSREGLMGGKN